MSSKQHYISYHAKVRFLTESEGGRITDPTPGVRPQIKLDGLFTSCIVQPYQDEATTFQRGKTIDVSLIPMFPENVQSLMSSVNEFEMYEGTKKIAVGIMIK
jgi:hypothetical protein